MANKQTEKSDSINLADLQRQIEALKEELAEAKSSVSGVLTEEQKKENEKKNAYWNELVKVKLFKDNNKYKDDVFVSVNGENRVIERGIEVLIERKFADVLEKSDLQDYETSMLIEKKSNEYAKSDL